MKKLYYDSKKCVACKTCEIVCSVGHSPVKDLAAAVIAGDFALPAVKVCFAREANFPLACRQCAQHPCVGACIAGAIEFDDKKGIVFDQEKCVGCWMCIMVCPYGVVRPDKRSGKSVRCDLCVETGEPVCAKSCPTKAIIYQEEEK